MSDKTFHEMRRKDKVGRAVQISASCRTSSVQNARLGRRQWRAERS
jgi:hypothetical protein